MSGIMIYMLTAIG